MYHQLIAFTIFYTVINHRVLDLNKQIIYLSIIYLMRRRDSEM